MPKSLREHLITLYLEERGLDTENYSTTNDDFEDFVVYINVFPKSRAAIAPVPVPPHAEPNPFEVDEDDLDPPNDGLVRRLDEFDLTPQMMRNAIEQARDRMGNEVTYYTTRPYRTPLERAWEPVRVHDVIEEEVDVVTEADGIVAYF